MADRGLGIPAPCLPVSHLASKSLCDCHPSACLPLHAGLGSGVSGNEGQVCYCFLCGGKSVACFGLVFARTLPRAGERDWQDVQVVWYSCVHLPALEGAARLCFSTHGHVPGLGQFGTVAGYLLAMGETGKPGNWVLWFHPGRQLSTTSCLITRPQ